jgi:hypothetical protein
MLVMQSSDFFTGPKNSGICLAKGRLRMALERSNALIERGKVGKTRLSGGPARCRRKFLRKCLEFPLRHFRIAFAAENFLKPVRVIEPLN